MDQFRCHDVRDMADGSGDVIVLFRPQGDRQRTQPLNKGRKGGGQVKHGAVARGEKIVGILQQMVVGIRVAGLFGAHHGMSADELRRHAQSVHRLLDRRLHAAHIGDEALRGDDLLKL